MNYNKETRQKYLDANKEIIKQKKKDYYEANKLKIRAEQKEWQAKNKDKLQKYQKERLVRDCLYKLKTYTKNSINQSFKKLGKNKPSPTEQILGCTYIEFKIYIESQFEDWMTWDNHGNPIDGVLELNKTWDIDHKIPLSSAKDEFDIIRLNHYTNLQPLCSYTNRFIKRDTND